MRQRGDDVGRGDRTSVPRTAGQHRRRRPRGQGALDEHHPALKGSRDPVLGLERRPQPGHLVDGDRFLGEPDPLDLREQVVTWQCLPDLVRAEERVIMQRAERLAEDLMAHHVVVVLGVSGEQVVQDQRQRRQA